MKTLLLLRHAKSDWSNASLADFDRPLNARGRDACAVLAGHMRRSLSPPDLVLCSPALRTRETWERIAAALEWAVPVHFDDSLYAASAAALLARLRALPENVGAVLLVGHNPGLQDLGIALAGQGEPAAAALAETFPTAALARFRLEADVWARLAGGQGRLLSLITPKDLAKTS